MKSLNPLLTKSRFKVGSQCPTKLFYLDKHEYGNKKTDDSFLSALAEGGFQVGALAKIYYPNGLEVTEKDQLKSVEKTNDLLTRKSVTLFEAAIKFENFFIRVDVLKKQDDYIEIIEVKAKSFDPNLEDQFISKNGKSIKSDWKEYLLDIAFQKFVVQKAFPQFKVSSFLMLADKSKTASVSGLNQLFLITKNEFGRTEVVTKDGTNKDTFGEKILCKINVDDAVHFLMEKENFEGKTFSQYAYELVQALTQNVKIPPKIESTKCKNCEFRIDLNKFPEGTKSGFFECFKDATSINLNQNTRPFVFDVWNFRKSQKLIEDGCYFMDELNNDDFDIKESSEGGLSASQRQLLQVQKVKNNDMTSYIDVEGLKSEFNSWRFPLHCIDFETTMVAIPFNVGRRPYEQIAFQFSHHMIHENGTIEHKNQYLHNVRGEFPNFDFVRALKQALDKDNGTIFRYSNHENTVLCQILKQIEEANPSDANILIEWIKTITTGKSDDKKTILWSGHRIMIDLCELVKKYYYSPMTNGSNSIKKVLPAVLNESKFLQEKYSKPIYGSQNGIVSLNFKDQTWLQKDTDGKIKDPYKLLPQIFNEEELSEIELLTSDEKIADGGAAMTAFARMQFSEMSESEAKNIQNALLKYCELDTLAMVMIYEFWKAVVFNDKK